ncbi:NADP-dependent alcohol dehydrogenase C 1 [Andreprevotia sp. IGB-42]|uniref:zinc-binding dehydrogenase n=1 Tax=Andreprevotia sp. IGB-42 TaxID=2497473 RepID=UPI001358B4EA|nr:zinc-binding dehydrogenase [Andreprevotia sp. IGB-42]KAF0813361.1 NADP-dependent alcohol dehydrogenase C 1 [Andreprevotia sp. IGB-42]
MSQPIGTERTGQTATPQLAPQQVRLEVLYCGICHAGNERQTHAQAYPCMPGHEVVGRVLAVGSAVRRFKVGDLAGVDEAGIDGFPGQASTLAVAEDALLHIPETLDLGLVAPLLCAGVATYSPLRHWKIGPGKKVGVIGMDGLGHMAILFASAMGAHVVLLTEAANQLQSAVALGADEVCVATDEAALAAHDSSFDLILSTIPARNDVRPYVRLLKRDATLVLVGGGAGTVQQAAEADLQRRVNETQAVLDFCAAHDIAANIEVIPVQRINAAYEGLHMDDLAYRAISDIPSLKARPAEMLAALHTARA